MKKSKSKFSKYLNGGDPKKPIVVNDPKDPRLQAYQDSLSLYTTSQGVQNFYKNNPRYSFKGETLINKDQLVFEELEKEKNRVINRLKVEGSFATDVSTGNLINKESDYYQRISDNKFKQRELNNFQLNLDAPMQEFNRKIKPDRYFRFQENSENVSKGDIVGIYSYSDKIAPKPTQPVEYQKSSNQGTLLQGEEYKKKHPPIYLDNPKDPRIGGYAEEGNQYLYQSKPLPKENISRLKTKDLGLVDSNTSRAKTLPVNKTKFNTNSNYTITSGISKTNTTYFPDEELLNEAVTNLRTKYPKSVQSQKSKGTANYDFPGATNDEVMKFKNGGKLRKMPDGGIIKPPIQTTDPNKVRAYNDSLQLHNLTKGIYDGMLGDMKNGVLPAEKVPYHISKMDEIIPKTDSLVNDLYDMGINYKVKGYNKVPIGSNGNFTEVGKLQKVAPMPKQPYFFKGGGKLSYGGSIGTGAASGAAMGATIGSIIPVWGTAAGAVIGGVAGGVGGYFKEKNQQESLERQEDLNTNLNPNFNMNPLGNSFKNGGYLPDQEYDLSEAEIEKLIRKGYKIKRLQ